MRVAKDILPRGSQRTPVSRAHAPHALLTASAAALLLLFAFTTAHTQTWTRVPAANVPNVYESGVAWGDYNNDGLLDFAVIGSRDTIGSLNSKKGYAAVFQNNGDGTFTPHTAGLMPVAVGTVTWGDYDNDGYLDLLYGGVDTLDNQVTKLYHNNHDGTFTENTQTAFHSSSYGSVAWSDFDNDGWLDILMSAYDNNQAVVKLYRNNHDGSFTEVTTAVFQGANGHSRVAWGDYDNDGYPDALLCGRTTKDWTNPQPKTLLYHNNKGNGTFTLDTAASFVGVARGGVAFGDFNNDGYLDILVVGNTGSTEVPQPADTAVVYLNNHGNGTFTATAPGAHIPRSVGSVAVGDFDADGKLDVLATGFNGNGALFKGVGNGTFTDVTTGSPDIASGGAAFGDFNGDGYLDAVLTGAFVGTSRDTTLLYRYSGTGSAATNAANAKPGAPTGLHTTIAGDTVRMSWSRATDDKTPSAGLTYAIRVGTKSGGFNVVSPLSDSTGHRRVAAIGAQCTDTSWTLTGLSNGTYYWSVQAIDNSYQGSAWSTESSFGFGNGLASYTPRSLNFGTVQPGQSKRDSIKVKNIGSALLKIVKTPLTGIDTVFAVTPDSTSIPVGDSAKVFVTFKPTGAGAFNTKLVYTADGVAKDTLLLSGSGGTPSGTVVVTPKALAFDSVLVLFSKRDSIKVKNTGGSAISFRVEHMGDTSFAVTPDSVSVNAGDSTYFRVTFRPTAAGPVAGSIGLANSLLKTDTVTFTGTGRLMTLSQVRKSPVGSQVSFLGTVTRARGSYTYMQDTAAGLVIFQSSGAVKDSMSHGYIQKGDRLIMSGKTSQFNNLLEIASGDFNAFRRVSRGDTSIKPVTVTLAQLKAGGEQYESRLVKVIRLQLVGNADTLFKAAKTYNVKDPTDTSKAVALRIPNAGDSGVDSTTVIPKNPVGKVWVFTFTGPLGQFNSTDSTKGYQLMAVDSGDVHFDSTTVITGVEEQLAENGIPKEFRLEQNYPNPFNPSTTIAFALPKQAAVQVKVYTMLGQEVATLVDGTLPAGLHRVTFQAGHLASGLYFYRIQAGDFTSVRKMMLVK